MGKKIKLGVLGSGKGSNFAAILRAIGSGFLPAQVELVISDVPNAGILALASQAGIPYMVVEETRLRWRWSKESEDSVVCQLQKAGVELIVLAGFMRIVGTPLLEAFPRRIINIHPSLLPKYPGLEAWKQALEAKDSVTGCTVHYVDSGIDTGDIIAQSVVSIEEGDTPSTLHQRIQEAEHELLPEVIRRFANPGASGKAPKQN